MPEERRGLSSGAALEGGQDMGTGESLSAPQSVQRLQSALHAKAKGSPSFRFYSLCDKVWRADVLAVACQEVRRNGGAPGVDGQTVAGIEAYGVDRWLGELARDLKAGTYRPDAVRQVLIPKKRRGQFRPLGIPCIRDRVAQTAAMLVLSPIFEADLAPEQYAYRAGRSAHDAVKRVHRLLNTGHQEVVDADLSDHFGQIPHAELLKSLARRVSEGRMLGWVKAWLEMAVEEDDGKGGKRRTNRSRRERKGTPQGSPISPLFSNIYMRRFIVGWKVLGYVAAGAGVRGCRSWGLVHHCAPLPSGPSSPAWHARAPSVPPGAGSANAARSMSCWESTSDPGADAALSRLRCADGAPRGHRAPSVRPGDGPVRQSWTPRAGQGS